MSPLEHFVHEAPIAVLTVGLLAAMLLSWQGGLWLRGQVLKRRGGDDDDGVAIILSSVLGLLALLVGFTFSLALERHEIRRTLVVTEANALGTAYLRTALLDDSERLRSLLRDYTVQRLQYGLQSGAPQAQALAASERLRVVIWDEAIRAVRPYRETDLAATLFDPLNEAFDTATARNAAFRSRVPTTVLITLGIYVAISAGVLGYAAGRRDRHRIVSAILFVLLSMAIALILDLDRPRGGAIRIPQTAMADTLAAMR